VPGLDNTIISDIDWSQAIENIITDVKSDFVLAPYIDIIYRRNGQKLADQLKSKLRSGSYNPQLPVTFSVPKAGMLTRPGSILLPHDRVAYQGLVQYILPKIEENFDRDRASLMSQRTRPIYFFDHLMRVGLNINDEYRRSAETASSLLKRILQITLKLYRSIHS
jgi:hypothetical protein